MKLMTVNMEGRRHINLIIELVKREQPDCLCLQEAPETFQTTLQALGYQTTYAPMITRVHTDSPYSEGVILASLLPMKTKQQYYYNAPDMTIPPSSNLYILGEITDPQQGVFHIATTHVMVTKNGLADSHQTTGIKKLLDYLEAEPAHILCGDFNMPRGYNDLYEVVTEAYTDTVPMSYKSSLDRSLHRQGTDPNLNAPIFDIYMVDYIFSKPEYRVENVRLQFGVSDHAAVIADISRNK